jgi:glycosyltransferase involved in cell wall biosynthesis
VNLPGWPTLTVILNTHNTPDTVRLTTRSLDSILSQEFSEPWEVIVVNDGKPSDELVMLMTVFTPKFEAKGVDLTFFGTGEESGYQCMPKNYGLDHSHGEYVCFLDMDNEYLPGHLQVLYDALTEGSVWPDFTYARRHYMRDEGVEVKATLPGGKEVDLPEGDSPFVEWTPMNFYMMSTSPLAGFVDSSDFMTSRGAFWRLHLATDRRWNEALRRFGDWEVIVRGAGLAGWRGKAVDKVLTNYFWTGKNLQLTRPATETPQGKVM